VGSVKVGKDADVVIWSTHPLSIYARAEKTFVDGILYYDREKEEEVVLANEAERMRLINKMIEAKNNGAGTRPVEKDEEHEYHCDDIEHHKHGHAHDDH
jgi:hypothetical protein